MADFIQGYFVTRPKASLTIDVPKFRKFRCFVCDSVQYRKNFFKNSVYISCICPLISNVTRNRAKLIWQQNFQLRCNKLQNLSSSWLTKYFISVQELIKIYLIQVLLSIFLFMYETCLDIKTKYEFVLNVKKMAICLIITIS